MRKSYRCCSVISRNASQQEGPVMTVDSSMSTVIMFLYSYYLFWFPPKLQHTRRIDTANYPYVCMRVYIIIFGCLFLFAFLLRWNFLLLLSVCSAVISGEEDYLDQGKHLFCPCDCLIDLFDLWPCSFIYNVIILFCLFLASASRQIRYHSSSMNNEVVMLYICYCLYCWI